MIFDKLQEKRRVMNRKMGVIIDSSFLGRFVGWDEAE